VRNGGLAVTTDIQAFDALHRPVLEQDEVRHNILLAIMGRALQEDPAAQTRTWSFGAPGACAVQSPGRGLVLGDMTQQHCRDLAHELAGTAFRSVLGADDVPHWFVDAAKQQGETFGEPMPQRIHQLSEKPIYPGAAGSDRLATEADADLFAQWATAFVREAAPEDQAPSRQDLDKKVRSGDIVFWIVDREPVAMAGVVRRLETATAIAWVYTPTELRGRGYGGSATAALVDRVLAEGYSTVCLYTDLRNPASNRCYEKIGFKPVCESWFFPQANPPAELS